MKKLVPIFTIFLLISCSSKYNKEQVTEYFKEINELNQILIDHKDQLKNDGLQTISKDIPESCSLIELLIQKINLTEIKIYELDGVVNRLGLAYRFGSPSTTQYYSFLLYTQERDHLKTFRYYEQFIDCGEPQIINDHWAFSRITVDCNN